MDERDAEPRQFDRRQVLRFGLAAACVLAPLPALAAGGARSLSFHNLHTGEDLTSTYWANGGLLEDSLKDINHILRDHRTGDMASIDVELLDLLVALRYRVDSNAPYHVISGYRSPRTNNALAVASNGVARKSLHMQGKAIDIRLPGRHLADLRQAAIALGRGGVGFYRKSDFIHVDTGRVRSW